MLKAVNLWLVALLVVNFPIWGMPCQGFLAHLVPHSPESISREVTVLKRVQGDLRERMIRALDLFLRQDPPGFSLQNQNQIAKFYLLLGLTPAEISLKLKARLLDLLEFTRSLIEETSVDERELAIKAEGFDRATKTRLIAWRAQLDHENQAKLVLIDSTGLAKKYQLREMRQKLNQIRKTNSALRAKQVEDYYQSLNAAFLLAVDFRDEELSMKFFNDMIRAGGLAFAARAAYMVRNEMVLMHIAKMSLSDVLAKQGDRFVSEGVGIEIAIEALGGIRGDLKAQAQELLSDLALALPAIYATAFAETAQSGGTKYAVVQFAERAKQLASGQGYVDGRQFFTNLGFIDFDKLPKTNLAIFAAELGQMEMGIKAWIKKQSATSSEQAAEWKRLGEQAFLEEDYETAFLYFKAALDEEGILRTADAGPGESALYPLTVAALIREMKAQ